MKKIIYLLALILAVSGCQQKNTIQGNQNSDFLTKPTVLNSTHSESQPTENNDQVVDIPNSINLDVPFVSQAPFKEWDDLHNEACEEAAVIGAILYLEKRNMAAGEKDQEIRRLVEWQEENFSGHYDLPIEKVKELVENYYHKSAKIISDVSVETIKNELANGKPVIVPAAGRILGNPYFKTPGPVYHMLVIRGYDDKTGEFITNDVGTNTKGENFRYKYNKLIDVIHDMPAWQQNKASLDANPDLIFSGKKVILVIQ